MTTKKKQLPSSGTQSTDSGYSEFVQSLELFNLALKSCHAEVDREALFSLKERLNIFTHKYRVTHVDDTCFDAEGDFELSISKSEDIAPAVKINCAFEVHMHGTPINPEYAERFAAQELRLILVPHARQFVFMVSGQMCIPPVILPLTTGGKNKKRIGQGKK